jgi:hypothetical protein
MKLFSSIFITYITILYLVFLSLVLHLFFPRETLYCDFNVSVKTNQLMNLEFSLFTASPQFH